MIKINKSQQTEQIRSSKSELIQHAATMSLANANLAQLALLKVV